MGLLRLCSLWAGGAAQDTGCPHYAPLPSAVGSLGSLALLGFFQGMAEPRLGLGQHGPTCSITSQGHVFEELFPSETQPAGKVRKPPHESWSETFRQDISPLECAGSLQCFVETV